MFRRKRVPPPLLAENKHWRGAVQIHPGGSLLGVTVMHTEDEIVLGGTGIVNYATFTKTVRIEPGSHISFHAVRIDLL